MTGMHGTRYAVVVYGTLMALPHVVNSAPMSSSPAHPAHPSNSVKTAFNDEVRKHQRAEKSGGWIVASHVIDVDDDERGAKRKKVDEGVFKVHGH